MGSPFELERDAQTEDRTVHHHVPLELIHSTILLIIPGKGPVAAEQLCIFFPEKIETITLQPS